MAANGNGKGKKVTAPPETLRVRREALGLSRAKLADEADVAVSRVWAAEHPEAGVDDETRAKIVKVLNERRDEIAKLPKL